MNFQINHDINLPDQRKVSVLELGNPRGIPLVIFHGSPKSKFFGKYVRQTDPENNFRIIIADRPGIGDSDLNPRGTFTSFAKDMKFILSVLHISKHRVLAISGGTPFAFAHAIESKDFVQVLGCLGGVSTLTKELLQLHDKKLRGMWQTYQTMPKFAKKLAWGEALFMKKAPAWLVRRVMSYMIADQEASFLMSKDGDKFLQYLLEDFKNHAYKNWRGVWHELYLLATSDWDDLARQVTVPTILFHGQEDGFAPVQTYQRLRELLPNVAHSSEVFPGETHFSAIQNKLLSLLKILENYYP